VGQPRFEVPSGTIDGANTVFTVSLPYVVGSTAVWLNGVLLRRDLDDGWTESNPATGEITLNEAPLATGPCPDTLQVFFKDTSVDAPETVIEQICGTISGESGLSGTISQEGDFLSGSVAPEDALCGFIADGTLPLVGNLEAEAGLTGTLEDCNG
jgi:hypothetical protein